MHVLVGQWVGTWACVLCNRVRGRVFLEVLLLLVVDFVLLRVLAVAWWRLRMQRGGVLLLTLAVMVMLAALVRLRVARRCMLQRQWRRDRIRSGH